MSAYPQITIEPALGSTFYRVAELAVYLVKHPDMPYVAFKFNGRRFRVEKSTTVDELEAQLYSPAS